jgi:Ras-related protein Rab-1A
MCPLDGDEQWDIAGPERFRTITSSYYRGAHACLLMYDVGDRSSFDRVGPHLADIRASNVNCQVVIIGCKSDLTSGKDSTIGDFGEVSRRVISYEEGAALAESLNLPFCECTSAVPNDDSVEMCMIQTTARLLKHLESLPPVVPNNRPVVDHNRSSRCAVM